MRRTDAWLAMMCAVSLTAMGVVSYELWRYKLTAGDAGVTPTTWPADTKLARSSAVPTVYLFAHPRCACTLASLAELRRIISRATTPVRYVVVFELPEQSQPSFLAGDAWDVAGSLADVERVVDGGGEEGRRFGALTSGHVVAYAPAGGLLFSGGITAARGHQGDNPAEERLVAALETATTVDQPRTLPIYGCALHDQAVRQ